MMKGPILGIAALAGLLAAPFASAQISYDYVQAAYLVTHKTPVLGDEDGTGAQLSFSYEVRRFLHVFAGYQSIDLDDLPLDSKTTRAGVGTDFSFSDHQSIYLDVSALSVDSDSLGTPGNDDNGYGASFGYRETNLTPLEFTISLDYFTLNDSDLNDTSLGISLQYAVKPRFKIEGGVRFAGDNNTWKLGIRYYLPDRLRRSR
jgi:hypothetical protein